MFKIDKPNYLKHEEIMCEEFSTLKMCKIDEIPKEIRCDPTLTLQNCV